MSMRLWPGVRDNGWLIDLCGSKRMAEFWASRFDLVHRGELDTWNYSYILSCWMDPALALTPNVNLIENIGFGAEATHTRFAPIFVIDRRRRCDFPRFNRLLHPGRGFRGGVGETTPAAGGGLSAQTRGAFSLPPRDWSKTRADRDSPRKAAWPLSVEGSNGSTPSKSAGAARRRASLEDRNDRAAHALEDRTRIADGTE
jgi:hypothetical protein